MDLNFSPCLVDDFEFSHQVDFMHFENSKIFHTRWSKRGNFLFEQAMKTKTPLNGLAYMCDLKKICNIETTK